MTGCFQIADVGIADHKRWNEDAVLLLFEVLEEVQKQKQISSHFLKGVRVERGIAVQQLNSLSSIVNPPETLDLVGVASHGSLPLRAHQLLSLTRNSVEFRLHNSQHLEHTFHTVSSSANLFCHYF